VCVFYALSGLALSYHTLSRHDRSPAVSGVVRRYPRLVVPVFTATMLAAGMLAACLFPVREASVVSGSSWWGAFWQFRPTVGSAVWEGLVGSFTSKLPVYDSPLWTMHNELVGSFLVFAVLIVAPRRWMRVVAYVVLAWFTYRGYLLAFVGGMVICEVWIARGERAGRWASCWSLRASTG
jgi:peptidoglycan/LPS O-acetylase OafA/YrhL